MQTSSPSKAMLVAALSGLLAGPFLGSGNDETRPRAPISRRAYTSTVASITSAKRKARNRRRNQLAKLSRRANRR